LFGRRGTCLISPTPTIAADFSGQVVGVLDGDTIEVLHHNHSERISLNGIDYQKKGQAYATRVKDCTGMAQVAAIIEVEHVEPSPLR